jgi:3-phenylpropionate/cinnamic acid dioxygenase small subunit
MSAELLALVHREAHLLDAWELDEWLALFAPDGIYWLPMEEGSDPKRVASIIHDDIHGLAIRVEQLMRQNRISQQPRSETIHFVTNCEVEAESPETAVVRYNLLITELRTGDWRQNGLGEMRQHPGRVRLEAVRVNGDWKIREKRLILLARQQPLEGLSYIL